MDDVLRLGPWRLRQVPWSGLGLVLEGLEHDGGAAVTADYVDEILLSEAHRDGFFDLIDHHGVVICRNVGGVDTRHEEVRGRSSRGRLSQGEYFHHDGCSGPVKPRVVEIRCPYQAVARHTVTSIAPFPEVVTAQVQELPVSLREGGELARWYADIVAGATVPVEAGDDVQGLINRTVRKSMAAEDARAYLRAVDIRVDAYREPWVMCESRFIANANPRRTMQHRRAYLEPLVAGRPNGRLVKRWPAGHDLRDEVVASLLTCYVDPA